MMMKVKGEMQVNEIEIFDGRRLCSDKLSSDLLPSRFICCTLLHFADHLVILHMLKSSLACCQSPYLQHDVIVSRKL